MKYIFNQGNFTDVKSFLSEESGGTFDMKITNYTISAKIEDQAYLFTDTPMSKSAFIFYKMMLKDLGGEIRPEAKNINYYDFTGIQKGDKIENCYCVDMNSAYLMALKNEKLISNKTFATIHSRTQKNKKLKMDRLKSVGMFASSPTIINFEQDEAVKIENIKNPMAWVFYFACQKTTEIIKSQIDENFLFYWVDGIFVRGNEKKIKKEIEKMGFPCKIEKINNLRVGEKSILFNKDGKEKIIFLPQEKKQVKINLENIKKI
jgi:hypothetical protein